MGLSSLHIGGYERHSWPPPAFPPGAQSLVQATVCLQMHHWAVPGACKVMQQTQQAGLSLLLTQRLLQGLEATRSVGIC